MRFVHIEVAIAAMILTAALAMRVSSGELRRDVPPKRRSREGGQHSDISTKGTPFVTSAFDPGFALAMPVHVTIISTEH
jgi:hypothetical protein